MKDGQCPDTNAPGILFKVTVILAAVLLAGCAGNQGRPTVGVVGPAPIRQSWHPTSSGSLTVFSARESVANPVIPGSSDSPGSGDSGFTWKFSSYKILSPSGGLIKFVNNNDGQSVTYPTKVELLAGKYLVKAETQKYGEVTVPVVIAAGQNTVLNLDNSGYWPRDVGLNVTNAVCFPDGTMIGWRADEQANLMR